MLVSTSAVFMALQYRWYKLFRYPVLVTASAATYLSLGDSLAVGVQPTGPNTQAPTNEGYADQLKDKYYPDLQLKKLGCPGETTGTMINGGICKYKKNNRDVSQLEAAVDFLQKNKNKVALVTIDIGANELLVCQIGMSLDSSCIINTLATIKANLPYILKRLHEAAPDVPIVGMNYYDPSLAFWLEGKEGRVAAGESLLVILPFNHELKQIYMAAGSPVAGVEEAFLTTNLVTQVKTPLGKLPINVAKICKWTWMCTQSDIHPNDTGYGVIAKAFADVLGLTTH